MNQRQYEALCEELGVDAILGLDWETFYDSDYSLRKMATTEYITDERFKTHMVSAQWHYERHADVLNVDEFRDLCAEVNWSRTAMLAHHTHFDGLILSKHFGATPAFYLDTLSMARALMPIHVRLNLHDLARALNLRGKVGSKALENVAGVRDLSPKQYAALAKYAGNDIEQTFAIFGKLAPCLPVRELRIIDVTIKMYTRPTILLNKEIVDRVNAEAIENKADLIKAISTRKAPIAKTDVVSNDKFAALLRAEGIEPPMKMRSKYAKMLKQDGVIVPAPPNDPIMGYAFAATDLDFKALLTHPQKRVRALVAARLANKTSIVETRSARMSSRSVHGPQPVYLNYAGAKTWRWSGGDKSNWQNLGRGSDLRKAIYVPSTHKLIIADLAQIEARMNAWISGQDDIVDAFARGEDVYALAASKIYGRTIDKTKNPSERFVGKVAVLALGYQAGGLRFANMLRVGQFGDPVEITDEDAKAVVAAWRQANYRIVGNWKSTMTAARTAFSTKSLVEHGAVSFEGFKDRGIMRGPDDIAMRYDLLKFDEDGSMSYASKHQITKKGEISEERTKLYGGILVENECQFLSRQVICDHILEIDKTISDARIVMSTHDEVVVVVPNRIAKRAEKTVREIMSVTPHWARGLPIAADVHVSQVYDK